MFSWKTYFLKIKNTGTIERKGLKNPNTDAAQGLG